MTITITEALAELKLIKSKVDKKQAFILSYLCRQDGLKDPLAAQGGSVKAIEQEGQAIRDLLLRIVVIRSAIANANTSHIVSVSGISRTVADWLVWRRDAAPIAKKVLQDLAHQITRARQSASQQGYKVVATEGQASVPTDLIINIDEKALANQLEQLDEVLGLLDGKLSLHNATATVEV